MLSRLIRQTPLSRLCILPVMLLGLAGGPAGCTVSDRQIIDQSAQFHDGLQPAVIRDPTLDRYINTVGQRIIEAARDAHAQGIGPKAHFRDDGSDWMFSDKMQFHFVNSKTMNAFTTGGEHMYIYTGLLQETKSEAELAAVMAHEYAHIYGRHVQKGTQRQYGLIGAAVAAAGLGYLAGGEERGADYAGLFGGGALMAGQLVGAGFTRKDEDEADKYGQLFYTMAGYDPRQFGNFFQTMVDKGLDTGPAFLSDHPSLASRVEAAQKRARGLEDEAQRYRRPPVAGDAEFRRIQQRAIEVGRTMPDDQTLEQTQELLQALPRSCLTPAIREDQIEAQEALQRDLKQAEERARRKRS